MKNEVAFYLSTGTMDTNPPNYGNNKILIPTTLTKIRGFLLQSLRPAGYYRLIDLVTFIHISAADEFLVIALHSLEITVTR